MSPNQLEATDDSLLLAYTVVTDHSPLYTSTTGTLSSGTIMVAVAHSDTVLCKIITLEVPIGATVDAVFQTSPAPFIISLTPSSAGWSSKTASAEVDASANSYSVVLTNNHTDENGEKDEKVEAFSLTISGTVNTLPGSSSLTITEYSKMSTGSSDYSIKSGTFPIEKVIPPFYLRNFISYAPASAELTATEFASGAAIKLNWESNGTAFALYKDAESTPVYQGPDKTYTLAAGAGPATDTTWVLVATLTGPDGQPDTLYATLTTTVTNPSLTPQTVAAAGTVSVGGTLSAAEDVSVAGQLTFASADGDKILLTAAGAAGSKIGHNTNWEVATYAGPGNAAAGFHGWYTSGASSYVEQMRLTNAGWLGIGTTTPFSQLANTDNNVIGSDTYGGGPNSFCWAASQDSYIGQFFNGDSSDASAGGVIIKVASSSACALDVSQGTNAGVNGTPLLHVLGSGNVGIGTTTPGQKLDVAGNIQASADLIVDGAQGNTGTFSDVLRLGGGGSGEGIGSKRDSGGNQYGLDFYTDRTNRLSITSSGDVGIGTSSPIAQLHVSGNAGSQSLDSSTVSWFSSGRNMDVSTSSSGTRYLSGYFDNGEFWVNSTIAAGRMNINSDVRIKQVLGPSDSVADLARLQQVQVTDYTYLDQLTNPAHPVKKVVAQQVQQVYPEAVSAHTAAIPNVYEVAASVEYTAGHLLVRTTKPHELPAGGGRMRLYTEQNQDLHVDALVVDAYTFRFASQQAYDQLFVYGKYVDDFLTVDYDALAMLNVSATQELARQVAELRQQNTAIQQQQQHLLQVLGKAFPQLIVKFSEEKI